MIPGAGKKQHENLSCGDGTVGANQTETKRAAKYTKANDVLDDCKPFLIARDPDVQVKLSLDASDNSDGDEGDTD